MSLALRTIAGTALIVLAGVAHASNGYTPKPKPAADDAKAATSEQVKADLAKSAQDGSQPAMNKDAGNSANPGGTGAKPRTREEVLEELRQAQADGSFRRIRTNRGF